MLLVSITGGWLWYIMNINGVRIAVLPIIKEHSYNIHQSGRDNKPASLPGPFPFLSRAINSMSGGRPALSNCSEPWPPEPAAFLCVCRVSFVGFFFSKRSFHLAVISLSFLPSSVFFFVRIHSLANLYRSWGNVIGDPLLSGRDTKCFALHKEGQVPSSWRWHMS